MKTIELEDRAFKRGWHGIRKGDVKGFAADDAGFEFFMEYHSRSSNKRQIVRAYQSGASIEIQHDCPAARQSKPCWHITAVLYGLSEVNGDSSYISLSEVQVNTTSPPIPTREKLVDRTPVVVGHKGDFIVLNAGENPEAQQQEEEPEDEKEEELEVNPDEEWLKELNLSRPLLQRVLAFREKVRQECWSWPLEDWKRIPNLGGRTPEESFFSQFMSEEDINQAKKVYYIPQGDELEQTLAPMVGDGEDDWEAVLLKGPKGTAKSLIANYAAAVLSLPVHRISGSIDTDEDKLLGRLELNGGETVFNPGVALKPIMRGGLLIADEVNQAPADVLSCLTSALDWQKFTTVHSQQIKVHPLFRVAATMNPGYHGTQPLHGGFKDRFRPVDFDYPEEDIVRKVIEHERGECDEDLIKLYRALLNNTDLDKEEVVSIRRLISMQKELQLRKGDKKQILHSFFAGMLEDKERDLGIIEDILQSLLY